MTKVDCKSQLKLYSGRTQLMACNDLLTLQKSAFLSLRREDAEHYLNPFGQLLFSQRWRWSSEHHQFFSKGRGAHVAVGPSLKKDILIWFENLAPHDKIAVTAIHSPRFTEPFIAMLTHRRPYRIFNLAKQRWVDGIHLGHEDDFFEELLRQLRVGYVSQPVLYFRTAQIMDIRMLDWLNKVSNSKVFEFASKGKKDEQNALWFSSVSYRYLQDWLANQIEMNIVSHFFNKAVPEFLLPLLQSHLKNSSKNGEANNLSLPLLQVNKKSKSEINLIKSKLKEEEEKFIELRQLKLLKSMESTEQQSKKKNKRRAKKKVVLNQKDTAQLKEYQKDTAQLKEYQKDTAQVIEYQKDTSQVIEQTRELTCQQTNNTNSPSLTPTLIVPQIIKQQLQEKIPQVNQPDQVLIKHETEDSKKEVKAADVDCKQPKPKNLIRVSPKRRLSPEHAKRDTIYDSLQLKQKYSEERYSTNLLDDQKSSDPPFSIGESNTFEQAADKKRRKRGKKQNQKLNEVKEILFTRFISRQIDNLVDQLGLQTNSLYTHKIISFERVRTYIQSLYPVVNAILFGSNAIGLSLPNSDVDILLTGLNCSCKEQASEILAQIAVQINAMGWVVSCSTYLWAKVPIVKLQIDTSIPFLQTKRKQDLFRVYNPALLYHLDHVGEMSAGTIKVDITINIEGVTSVGYESTVLMREWISMMPILQKLVLLLKYLLSYHGYNSNFTGGIGSYCLFVMVAAYMKDNAKEKEGNEAKEFLNILKWYGEEFDNLNNSVWLREEGNCFISQQQLTSQRDQNKRDCLLRLIDPVTGKYMNSSFSEYNNIKMQFRRIDEELNACRNVIENELRLGGVTAPELMKVVQSKKGIDKWLNRLEQKHELSLRGVIERTFN